MVLVRHIQVDLQSEMRVFLAVTLQIISFKVIGELQRTSLRVVAFSWNEQMQGWSWQVKS